MWLFLPPEEHTVIGERPGLTQQSALLIPAIIVFVFPVRFAATEWLIPVKLATRVLVMEHRLVEVGFVLERKARPATAHAAVLIMAVVQRPEMFAPPAISVTIPVFAVQMVIVIPQPLKPTVPPAMTAMPAPVPTPALLEVLPAPVAGQIFAAVW